MKNSNDNQEELQLVLDSVVQALSDIKEELSVIRDNETNSTKSALNTDLLNKISDTIDNAKKAINEEDLKKFLNAVIAAEIALREKADKAFIEFLNQKIKEISQFAKRPTIIKNHYSIDFKSSKTFIAIVILCLGIGISLYFNYNQFQENKQLADNDLKYRFIKMKNGIIPEDIERLENFFFYSDSIYVVNNIRKKVIDYEYRLKEQVRRQEQKKRSEEEIEKLDKEIELLNIK